MAARPCNSDRSNCSSTKTDGEGRHRLSCRSSSSGATYGEPPERAVQAASTASAGGGRGDADVDVVREVAAGPVDAPC